MKNVYLIDLATGSNMNLLPLSIGMVGSYSMAQQELAGIYDFHFQYLRGDHMDKVNAMIDPAVVGVACYIWNIQGSLRLTRMVKQRFPKAKVVLGGFSIPKSGNRVTEFFANNPHVDALVHGEGEIVFANLLRSLADGRDLSGVKGITFRTPDVPDGFVCTGSEHRIIDMKELPSPFLNGVFDGIMDRFGDKVTGALWETNRGCPYSCTFCDWGNADVSKIKKYDMDRLQAEMDWIGRNEFFYMFIADANFGIFVERDMEIVEMIVKTREKYGALHHLGTNWAKNKHQQVVSIADRLALGGIACNITLAVQSYHEPTLDAIKRRNIKQGDMLNLKKQFHDRNIPTYMEVILGLPLETYDSFVCGLNKALTPRISDRFFVYLCQLLENTELASPQSREKFQIESRHCWHTVSNRKFEEMEDREIEEFIVGTSTLPGEDWGRAYLVAYLLTVLYNHRVAFFVLNFLHHSHDVTVTDFVEFVLDEWKQSPDRYPQMYRGIDHLEKQRDQVLAGKSYMSGIEGSEDLIMLPAVGAVCLMLGGEDGVGQLYREIRQILLDFAAARGIEIEETIVEDIINYQQARMPAFPVPEKNRYQFNTNIPEYFGLLTAGLEPPEIIHKKLTVTIEGDDRSAASFAEFAATLVRGSLAVDLLEVNIAEGWLAPENVDTMAWLDDRRRDRRMIEQQSTDKLKNEFRKLKDEDGDLEAIMN